ncbi:MAG: hydroxymethylglutaryl-CoA lyase [Alphaproteobacteria bacterium]
MNTGMNRHVEIVDVTLRDGLQDEPVFVPTDAKLSVLAALLDAGLKSVEVTSFVNPARVPQMADAETMIAGLPRGVDPVALILNGRGFERAVAAFDAAGRARGEYALAFVISASPRHHRSNSNRDIAETLAEFAPIAARAADMGVRLHAAVSCAFASPWDDETITDAEMLAIVDSFDKGRCALITLCDTVGKAQPDVVARRVAQVARRLGRLPAVHLHGSATAVADNVRAALRAGARRFEAALGGLGGCPFAPDAPGNIDIAVLNRILDAEGYPTGLDEIALDRAAALLFTCLRDAPKLPKHLPLAS